MLTRAHISYSLIKDMRTTSWITEFFCRGLVDLNMYPCHESYIIRRYIYTYIYRIPATKNIYLLIHILLIQGGVLANSGRHSATLIYYKQVVTSLTISSGGYCSYQPSFSVSIYINQRHRNVTDISVDVLSPFSV